MDRKNILIYSLALCFAVSGVIGLFFLHFSPLYLQPDIKPISKPVPVKISSVQGKILQLDDNVIMVIKKDKTYSYPSNSINDVQRITSGSIEQGNAKTIEAKKGDLKVGQTVFIVADRNLNSIRSIYIVN